MCVLVLTSPPTNAYSLFLFIFSPLCCVSRIFDVSDSNTLYSGRHASLRCTRNVSFLPDADIHYWLQFLREISLLVWICKLSVKPRVLPQKYKSSRLVFSTNTWYFLYSTSASPVNVHLHLMPQKPDSFVITTNCWI